ncbi:MAG TPA: aminoglycoside phosphotransferase family protein [Gemmatimonadales bacterium]|nr:aminoglycoside phosphotransferase family protein [Gemmatimonadales bacterium]
MSESFAGLLGRFDVPGEFVAMEPLPGGYINDSYRVTLAADGARTEWLLQRINPTVFTDPDALMGNIAHVTRHMSARLRDDGVADWRRRTLVVIPTREGASHHRGVDGAAWRLFPFIESATVRTEAASPELAREAARAFGEFLRLVADYDGPPLRETIRGFHDTAARFRALVQAVRADPVARAAQAGPEIRLALEYQAMADVLPPLMRRGVVPVRVAHNDAKIANVLFEVDSGRALAVVDLDTVMPGSALHDFGDLVRSSVSASAEDETDLAKVDVRVPWFRALVEGYLSEAGGVLTPDERRLLVFAGRLITLEQAVRFLTDHLQGDRYYRTTRAGQNLDRARTQFRLFERLTERSDELEATVG